MGTVQIYALVEPGPDGACRYIGKARNAKMRFQGHLRDSRRRDTPVYRWIRKLLNQGQMPVMLVLRDVPEEDWARYEIGWIKEARDLGWPLLNVADGGEQPHCPREVRAENGRKIAKLRVSTPYKAEMYKLVQRLGICLQKGYGTPELRAKLRKLAEREPHIFPQWLDL